MKKQFSEFLSLNWWDAVKSLIVSVLSAIAATFYEYFTANTGEPINWKSVGGVAAAAAVGYILKNWLTNSVGQPMKTETAALKASREQ